MKDKKTYGFPENTLSNLVTIIFDNSFRNFSFKLFLFFNKYWPPFDSRKKPSIPSLKIVLNPELAIKGTLLSLSQFSTGITIELLNTLHDSCSEFKNST